MAHPFSSQAKSSEKARLKRLGATAGKSFGSSSMYKATSYPSKNAGSSTSMTIGGGSSKKRPDRMASGGMVGGGKKRRPHATTNIIISHAGGRGGSGGGGGAGPNPQPVPVPRPVPVPVNRPVPVPVGGGGPGPMAGPAPGGPPPGAGMIPPRPPIAPPAGPPPGAGLPMRPPGMKTGGAVKKAAKGGFLKESNSSKTGDAYPGFPHSPTTKAKSTVSAHAAGGAVKKASGGGITLTKKLEFGGGTGLGMGVGAGPAGAGAGPGQAGPAGAANAALGAGPGRVPLPPQQGAPNVSGRQAIPFAQPNVVPLSGFGARNFSTRPAPGTTTTYAKRGGFIKGEKHDDEAQDKKLIKKMIAKEEKTEAKEMKKASGGGVGPGLVGYKYRTNSPKGGTKGGGGKGLSPYSDAQAYHNQGKGYADGGNVHGAGSAAGRLARNNTKIPAKTEL